MVFGMDPSFFRHNNIYKYNLICGVCGAFSIQFLPSWSTPYTFEQ